ncbi:Coatomer subunit delta-1 [Acorus calamus]|uniref:Coatomer subunit delta n=1 Tax=Acorus calamus TaxID=4465 RepID=A0AAV9F3I1_ACOCL|nr:Coatomer subunit delta-1 [Acorus calamus]
MLPLILWMRPRESDELPDDDRADELPDEVNEHDELEVPEYSPSLDEEGVCSAAFELIFSFDEVISLGHKESVTVAQVKQYCEMESHEEKLHKLVVQSKINETKDVMKRKASEIDKSKIEKNRGDKGGLMSISGPSNISSGFSEVSLSSGGSGGFGSGSGFGLNTEVETFSGKSKGRPPASASAPPKGLGMQLGKTQKTNQFLESLKAEGEVILEDVKPSVGQAKAPIIPTDPITLTIEEKLSVMLKRDGGLSNFDVQGTLSLQILNQEDGFIQVQIENTEHPGLSFKTHPNINKELFNHEHILGLKDPNRPFPSGQTSDPSGAGLMKWRIQGMNEDSVPLTTSEMFDLQNVVISVPLPALRDPPSIRQIDGEWRYDPRSSMLEWSILLIDNSNRNGSMEFVVPPADSSAFFPINIRFTASNTFSNVKVTNVLPLKGGAPPKFAQRIQLVTENYRVI